MLEPDRPALAARLRRLDTCAVSDALDGLGLTGAVGGQWVVSNGRRIAGPVITVRLGRPGPDRSPRHLCAAAIDAAEPGDVIVVEHGTRDDAAGWGGILSVAARARGLAGAIIDGAVRDVDESRRADFPVYARSVVPMTARGRVVELDWNERVTIAGIEVVPGDLVIADGSGVVFVAASHALDVIRVAEGIAAREAAMAIAVRQGRSVSEVMGRTYEDLLTTVRIEK
jgi:regulator of RNase E activity RraA